jgi:hypothetical protein
VTPRRGGTTHRRLIAALRWAYPEAVRIVAVSAPHGYRVLVISREFLALCPEERELDLARRLRWDGTRIALACLVTPDEERLGDWPFVDGDRFLDPRQPWRGVA